MRKSRFVGVFFPVFRSEVNEFKPWTIEANLIYLKIDVA